MSKKGKDIIAGLILLTLIAVGCLVLGTWIVKGLWTFVCWSWGLV